MKADRVVAAMIVATTILVTPNVHTNLVLAQSSIETRGKTNGGTTGGGTTDTEADESALYDEFQSCLESAAGGTTGFATEDEIRECFIEAGQTGAGDDNNNDEEENTNNQFDTRLKI